MVLFLKDVLAEYSFVLSILRLTLCYKRCLGYGIGWFFFFSPVSLCTNKQPVEHHKSFSKSSGLYCQTVNKNCIHVLLF